VQEKINHKPENDEEAPRVLLPEEALALVKVQEERLRRIQALGLGFWIFMMICGGVVYHTFPVMLGLFLGGGIFSTIASLLELESLAYSFKTFNSATTASLIAKAFFHWFCFPQSSSRSFRNLVIESLVSQSI